MQAVTRRSPEATTARTTPTRVPQRVIVPLDGTDAARAVLPLAYLLAGTFETPIHRVHVADRRERLQDHARRAQDEAFGLIYGLASAGRNRALGDVDYDEVAVIADGEDAGPDELAVVTTTNDTDDDAYDGTQDLEHGPAVIDSDAVGADAIAVIGADDAPEDDDAGPDVEVVLPGDDAAEMLADYVRTRPDAVVCMASRARGGLHRRLVGNVTEQVVRASACPVVAIGPNADHGAIGRPPATFLLAVGNGLPAHTIEVVAAWARAFGAEVVAAHVDPPVRAGVRDDRAQDEVVALSNRLQGLGVEARGRIVAGPRIADALLTVAASLPQPLLLVAPVGPRDDTRVPTDVTHQLLHAGRWPVLASVGRP